MITLWIALAIAMVAFLAGFIVRDLISPLPALPVRPTTDPVDLTVAAARGELRLGAGQDEEQPVRGGGRLVW